MVSRLFEKLVFQQFYDYLNKKHLSSDQSGFLHSTVSCLLKTIDDWYSTLDNSELFGVVLIDIKKAFDNVDHSILCNKLRNYGVLENELLWFKSYISNRKQLCRVNGADSKLNPINIGVPQGSCLGPLLFLVYINDLSRVVNQTQLPFFLMILASHFELKSCIS